MDKIYHLDSDWENIEEIIPFGYGRIGRRVIGKLEEHFRIPFIIDNNPEWVTKKTNYPIYSLNAAKEFVGNRKIVVTTTDHMYLSAKRDLEDAGFVENKNFCILSHFFGEWHMKYKNLLYISKIDTIITSRCTLPCPHCSMHIHDCDMPMDYPLEKLCKNFDIAFKVIDYVMEYSLFGGEPFIYKDLDKLITYLMSNYGDKIGRLVLITNGNVKPTEEIWDVLVRYNVMLSISNYTHRYNYKETQEAFLAKVQEKGIEYSFNDELIWKNVGYPESPANIPDNKAREHFKICGHSTFSINEGRLYFCDSMYGAEVNTGYHTKPDDIVDIENYIRDYGIDETKRRILEYIEGNINDLGCPSYCQLCRGVGDDNDLIIEAGS